jgi:hypothetical protein
MDLKDELLIKIENKYKKDYKKDIESHLASIIYQKCKEGHELNHSITRTVNIMEAYSTYLKREADIEGFNSYFISNMNIEGIKKSIMNSEEYKNIK